jgi:transcriptional/translational regulatory protein YebC/TACO1
VADIRHAFTKAGGNLGTDGSVAYLFSKQGEISFQHDIDEEKLLEIALEAGADDLVSGLEHVDVIVSPDSFSQVLDRIRAAGFVPDSAEVTMSPATKAALDVDLADKVLRLIDRLEDLDDVQNVYTNADFTADLMAQLG